MHHFTRPLCIAFVTLVAAGCAGGEPPAIDGLRITTSPVIRGEQANGSFSVSDPDGLGDLEIAARIISPLNSPIPFAEPSFSDEQTELQVAFAMILAAEAPSGRYQLGIRAIDVDDMESEEAVVEFDVQ